MCRRASASRSSTPTRNRRAPRSPPSRPPARRRWARCARCWTPCAPRATRRVLPPPAWTGCPSWWSRPGAPVSRSTSAGRAPRLPPPGTDLAAFRIVQEALTNVVRHSGSRHARVRLDDSGVTLRICGSTTTDPATGADGGRQRQRPRRHAGAGRGARWHDRGGTAARRRLPRPCRAPDEDRSRPVSEGGAVIRVLLADDQVAGPGGLPGAARRAARHRGGRRGGRRRRRRCGRCGNCAPTSC